MSLVSILTLALAMLILAVTPGPGVLATTARALASGFRPAVFVVLGIVVGDLIFLLSAIYGLAAIAVKLHGLFVVIKYCGAAYLIYSGIRLWRARPTESQVKTTAAELPWSSNFLTGLFITLGNPKVVLFYLGFLPTFVDLPSLSNSDVAIVAVIVSLVLGLTMLAYAYTASRARSVLHNAGSQRWINCAAGSVMIATGTTLATKS